MSHVIIIPTMRSAEEVASLLEEIHVQSRGSSRVIVTAQPASAAANRNYGLAQAEGADAVVMMDDDVECLPEGWDLALVRALDELPIGSVVSARLMRPDGTQGIMLGVPFPPDGCGLRDAASPELPTACIAFAMPDVLEFDEGFVGSGYEDTAWCAARRHIFPKARFVVHEGVRVVHRNEMKVQAENNAQNRERYEALWGGTQ